MSVQTSKAPPTRPPAVGGRRAGRGRGRTWLGRVLALLLVAAIFGKVLPDLVDLEEVTDILRTRVSALDLIVLSAFTALSVLLSAIGLSAALPGLRLGPASVVNVVTTALSYALPGGGAAGAALNVRMSRDLGFRAGPIALQVLVTGIWNLVARLTLPLLALGMLAMASDVLPGVRGAGALGLWLAAVLVMLTAVMLWSDRAASAIVAGLFRAARPVARLLHRRISDRTGDVGRFQGEARELIRARWPALTLSAVGYHVCVFAVLYVSLQAAGVSRVGVLEAFTVYTVARQVTAVPLTPGSAGVLELALIGGLDLTGADLPAATAGVLLFRFFTYLHYHPAGGAAGAWWRWLRPTAAARPHEVAFRHPMDAVRLVLALGALLVLVAVSRGVPGWDIDLFRLVNLLPDSVELPMWLVMQAGWVGAVAVAAPGPPAHRPVRVSRPPAQGGGVARRGGAARPRAGPRPPRPSAGSGSPSRSPWAGRLRGCWPRSSRTCRAGRDPPRCWTMSCCGPTRRRPALPSSPATPRSPRRWSRWPAPINPPRTSASSGRWSPPSAWPGCTWERTSPWTSSAVPPWAGPWARQRFCSSGRPRIVPD